MFNAFKIRDQQRLAIIRHLELSLLMVDPARNELPVEPSCTVILHSDHLTPLSTNTFPEQPMFDEKTLRRHPYRRP